MGVWAVSLSTHQLSPTSLTTGINKTGIRSLIDYDRLPHHEPFSALPPDAINQRYTLIYFGENQLSPGSFGILPLTSGHLSPLLRTRVRASSPISEGLTLPKVSSPGFGFNDCYKFAQLGLAFATSPQRKLVKLTQQSKTHRLILQ